MNHQHSDPVHCTVRPLGSYSKSSKTLPSMYYTFFRPERMWITKYFQLVDVTTVTLLRMVPGANSTTSSPSDVPDRVDVFYRGLLVGRPRRHGVVKTRLLSSEYFRTRTFFEGPSPLRGVAQNLPRQVGTVLGPTTNTDPHTRSLVLFSTRTTEETRIRHQVVPTLLCRPFTSRVRGGRGDRPRLPVLVRPLRL